MKGGSDSVVDLIGKEQGADVFVLGTGTSLKGFRWDKMNDRVTIALNNAAIQPGFYPTYHLFSDEGLWRRYHQFPYAPTTRVICQRGAAEHMRAGGTAPAIHIFHPSGRPEATILDTDQLFVCRTVATAGVQLAWKLGARRIFILGVDAYRKGRDFYCDGTPKLLDTADQRWVGDKLLEPCHLEWIRDMERVRKDFNARGLYQEPFPGSGVFNLSPESQLTAWDKVAPEAVLGGGFWNGQDS